jgi:hypothetical protein
MGVSLKTENEEGTGCVVMNLEEGLVLGQASLCTVCCPAFDHYERLGILFIKR